MTKQKSSWEAHGVPGNPDGCLVPVIFRTTSCKNMGCCIFTKPWKQTTKKHWEILPNLSKLLSCCFPAWCPVKQISYLYGTKCNKTQLLFFCYALLFSVYLKILLWCWFTLHGKVWHITLLWWTVWCVSMPSIDHQLFCGAEFCDACKGYFLGSNNEEIFFPQKSRWS